MGHICVQVTSNLNKACNKGIDFTSNLAQMRIDGSMAPIGNAITCEGVLDTAKFQVDESNIINDMFPNRWIPCLVLWKHTLETLDHVFEEPGFFGFGVQSINPITQLPCALRASGHTCIQPSSEPHVLGGVHNDLSSRFAHDGEEHESETEQFITKKSPQGAWHMSWGAELGN